MRIKIAKATYNTLKNILKRKLIKYLKDRGVKEINGQSIDDDDIKDGTVFKYKLDDKTFAFGEMLNYKVGESYFAKESENFPEGVYYSNADEEIYKSVLTFLGYKAANVFDQFKLFLRDESQEIPENIILYQENLLNNKTYVAKTPEQDQLDIETKYRRFKRLAGTTWFIYFYGYGIKEQDNNENEWTLVKLVLSFTQDNKSKNLKVQIKNSPNNKDHYNYIRKGNVTDIEVSGDDVLVINLRTEFNTRQLNLKVYVGDATSSFYLGQYLNYEVNQGHIISGTIIMEQATVDNPLPNVYKFRENFESDPMFLAQIQEIRHVMDFFKDKKINFRRTTTRVNSLETFIAWQNERKYMDLKKLSKHSEKIKMLVNKEIDMSDMAKIFDVSEVVMSEYLETLNNK